jgi:hypothetical protein
MDDGALTPLKRDHHARDAKATPVRVVAGLLLCPLLLIDLVLVGLAPTVPDGCASGRCPDHLTNPVTAAPVFWLAAVVALLIAFLLPDERRFRTARVWVLLGSATSALTTLVILLAVSGR